MRELIQGALTAGIVAAVLAGAVAYGMSGIRGQSDLAKIVATDASGNEYVAGSGDDCASAWQDAKFPENTYSVICEQAH